MEKVQLYRNSIFNRLIEYTNSLCNKEELKKSCEYTLLNSGKLARSVIILLGLDELKFNFKYGLDVACALEMVQSYTLIHDDLPGMDNASLRRGKKCNHLEFGVGKALLTGDALLTDSFSIIANSNLSDLQKVEIIKIFASKAGSNGVCYGQIIDLNNNLQSNDIDQINKIIKYKTCSLFELSFMSIGVIANTNKETIKKLEKIGYLFGLTFQIKDDLDDYLKESNLIGKDINQDLSKNTYYKIYGIEKTKNIIDKLLVEIENECNIVFGINNKMYQYLISLIK